MHYHKHLLIVDDGPQAVQARRDERRSVTCQHANDRALLRESVVVLHAQTGSWFFNGGGRKTLWTSPSALSATNVVTSISNLHTFVDCFYSMKYLPGMAKWIFLHSHFCHVSIRTGHALNDILEKQQRHKYAPRKTHLRKHINPTSPTAVIYGPA